MEPTNIVDELAQFIRQVDGNNKMGAGSLAEKICERFRVDTPAVQGECLGVGKCTDQGCPAHYATAPDVQGEPIGWYTEDHLDDKSATTYSAEVAQRWRDKGWPVWPLYTTPQPAEQQPQKAVGSRQLARAGGTGMGGRGMKLHVVVSDYGAAANVGGNVEITAKAFDLPEEIAEYIRSSQGKWQSVTLAFEDERENSHDNQ